MALLYRFDVVRIGEDPEGLLQHGVVDQVGHLGRILGVGGHPLLDHLLALQLLVGRKFGQGVGEVFGTVAPGIKYAGGHEPRTERGDADVRAGSGELVVKGLGNG